MTYQPVPLNWRAGTPRSRRTEPPQPGHTLTGGAETFYTTAHGSGRVMSRRQAKRTFHGRTLQQQMKERGIYIRCVSYAGLAEEAGSAYKNIDEVMENQKDLAEIVVELSPLAVMKG